MIDKTHFRISSSATQKLDDLSAEALPATPAPEVAGERLSDVEKRLALFEELLFDCAMTLKDKVADRLDQLEDLCHHETALLRQEYQQDDQDRKKELNLLTLKISEAIDRIAAEKNRQSDDDISVQKKNDRLPNLNDLPSSSRPSQN
ncbi:MAG: hypothetical protein GXP30_14995 [Verrucomicrobia bacterium]|nr:hypothetical protein [Verrucomicrobiota bacterium]